jgi:protocatechuate 3,4-dioxygenase beta subunit
MSPLRRNVLLGLVASAAIPPLSIGKARAQADLFNVPPTPACGDDDEPTLAQTEGPYFTPNSPAKRDLFADSPGGERMLVGGLVLDTACNPLPDALIEIWHADEAGAYDNEGFKLRGHQMSDANGVWWFETIVPGLYPGRTRHYHFKVQQRGGSILTTQLYFPDEPANQRDRIYDERLLMEVSNDTGDRVGRYNFILGV